MPPVNDGTTVDRDEITRLEDARARNPVYDLGIDGNTDDGRIAVVAEEGRLGTCGGDAVRRYVVQRAGGDAGRHGHCHLLQRLCHDQPRLPHHGQLIG
jgi:hypothetical protein